MQLFAHHHPASYCSVYLCLQTGVTHVWGGVAYELVPHHQWFRDCEMFSVLKKLTMFRMSELFQVSSGCCALSDQGMCDQGMCHHGSSLCSRS